MPDTCQSKVSSGRWEAVICAMNGGVERIKVQAACRCGQAGMTLLEALAGAVIKQEEPHLAALLHKSLSAVG